MTLPAMVCLDFLIITLIQSVLNYERIGDLEYRMEIPLDLVKNVEYDEDTSRLFQNSSQSTSTHRAQLQIVFRRNMT